MSQSGVDNKDSKSRVLGRGLSSLFQSTANIPDAVVDSLSTLSLNQIEAHADQPRKHFDAEALAELADSIKQHGILQPLVVQKQSDNSYLLIAGERRLRAARIAGLREVPVIIRKQQADAEKLLELALIENIQREDLNPLEESRAYVHLMDTFSLSQEDVAKKVGKKRSTVANALRLLKLPIKVQNYLSEGTLTAGQVRPLISLGDPKKIVDMAEQIISGGLSARVVEQQSATIKKGKKSQQSVASLTETAQNNAIKSRLRRRFATKVDLKEKNGRGRIELHFYSKDELQRLLALMQA